MIDKDYIEGFSFPKEKKHVIRSFLQDNGARLIYIQQYSSEEVYSIDDITVNLGPGYLLVFSNSKSKLTKKIKEKINRMRSVD